MLVKHMRLTKDVVVQKGKDDREFAYGTGVYDIYRGKDNEGKPRYESVFINLQVNSERELSFLKNFGKKGSVLKIIGEISPGTPFQRGDNWVSTINLAVQAVTFSDVRISNQNSESSPTPSGSSSPAKKDSAKSTATEEQEVEDIFSSMFDEDDETA